MQKIIQKNLKMKLGSYYILCTDEKNLQKISVRVWLSYLNMETIFMNTENSKADESNKFIYHFTDKLNLKTPNNKNIGLVNLSIYYTWKNIKSAYNNNKFKISAPTWNDEFHLPDGSCSISDIQDYFKFIIKKQETLAENPLIQIYPSDIQNRIVFKIKTG